MQPWRPCHQIAMRFHHGRQHAQRLRWPHSRAGLARLTPSAAEPLRGSVERRHDGGMATPEEHRQTSEWLLAHGRELRQMAEEARERGAVLRAEAEAVRKRVNAIKTASDLSGRKKKAAPANRGG